MNGSNLTPEAAPWCLQQGEDEGTRQEPLLCPLSSSKSWSSIIQLMDYPSLSFLCLCPFRFPPSPPEETARERKKNETHSLSMFTMSQLHHQSLGNTDRVSGSFSFSNKILLVYTLQLALPMRMQFKKILKELTYTFPKIVNITIDINGHSLHCYKPMPDGTTFCALALFGNNSWKTFHHYSEWPQAGGTVDSVRIMQSVGPLKSIKSYFQ